MSETEAMPDQNDFYQVIVGEEINMDNDEELWFWEMEIGDSLLGC